MFPLSWWFFLIGKRYVLLLGCIPTSAPAVDTIVQAAFCHSGVATTHYSRLCKVTNVLSPVLSIATNISVMLIILWKAWYVISFRHCELSMI